MRLFVKHTPCHSRTTVRIAILKTGAHLPNNQILTNHQHGESVEWNRLSDLTHTVIDCSVKDSHMMLVIEIQLNDHTDSRYH